MKKLLVISLISVCPLIGNAQIASSTSNNLAKTTKNYEGKEYIWGIDACVGSMAYKNHYYDEKYSQGAFGVGAHLEHHSNQYIAWDVVSVFWDAPFDSPSEFDRLSIKTGVRGFTPKFHRNFRGFLNLDLGYSLNILRCYDYYEEYYVRHVDTSHALGLEFSFGLRIADNFGLGYTLNWDSDTKLKGNYLRLSILF